MSHASISLVTDIYRKQGQMLHYQSPEYWNFPKNPTWSATDNQYDRVWPPPIVSL